MNVETGEVRHTKKLSADERRAVARDGLPLWVPMTREHLPRVKDPIQRRRLERAIEKRERRAAARKPR